MRQRYPVGSTVWCVWDGGNEYAARVMKYDEKRGEFRYKVHFQGWNSRHDEWVAESQLRINKNPITVSPLQGPVRYSPVPETSKKKNGKRRKEEDRPHEERRVEKEMRESRDQKPVKRKIEVLSDIPPTPLKRSKAARMKYSPPPKPPVPSSGSRRGRPPKNPPPSTADAAAAAYAAGPSNGSEKSSSLKYRSRYDEAYESIASGSSDRVLSPSTVRRRKKAIGNGGIEIDETQDGHRTPQDTHPPDMGSPTSAMLSLAVDLYLEYGGRLKSPEGRQRKGLGSDNKKEVIASLVENFKRDEKVLEEERKRKWRHYLEFKRRMVKDFEKYLVPTGSNERNRPTEGAAAAAASTTAALNGSVENGGEMNGETELKREKKEMKREEMENGREDEKMEEMKAEEIEMKEEVEEKGTSPTEATTASPTDTAPKPSTPTGSAVAAVAAPLSGLSKSVAPSTTSPLTVTTSGLGTSGGITPSPSPILPPSLKPNPNVPQDQSYAHIPFVGAETARAVVSQLRAERAQQMRVGSYMQHGKTSGGGVRGGQHRSYMMSGNAIRTVASSSSGSSRVVGRPTLFVAPSIPSFSHGGGGNGKVPHLVQPKKMAHDNEMTSSSHHYGGPSTSSGNRGNGGMRREWYSPRDTIEFVDDFSQGVVAEEVVVTEDMEMVDGNEAGPSSRPPSRGGQQTSGMDRTTNGGGGGSDVRTDHCYGTTSAAKARQREQQLASREYPSHGPGGATVVSASSMAAGGGPVRQRLVVPRLYNTHNNGATPLLTSSSSSSVRPIHSLVTTSSGSSTSGYGGNPVYIGVSRAQTGGTQTNNVSRTFRFRPAPGGAPILHNGVGGAGNVRLVDSRRFRPVYVRAPGGITTATTAVGTTLAVAPTRVTPAGTAGGGGMNGGNGAPLRRVAYISPPVRTTRLIIPKTGNGSGGVTMAAARAEPAAAAASADAAPSQPPVLQPEKPVTQQQPS